MNGIPRVENLWLNMTPAQKEVIACLNGLDEDMVVDEMDSGNLTLLLDCCKVASNSGGDITSILFEGETDLFTFIFNSFVKITNTRSYSFFSKTVEPLSIKVTHALYKRFKKYCEEEHPESNPKNFFQTLAEATQAIGSEAEQSDDNNSEKSEDDFWDITEKNDSE